MTSPSNAALIVGAALTLSPLLFLVFYPFYHWWKQDRNELRERDLERKLRTARERDSYLYCLIENQKGRVTLMQYALDSGLSAEEARAHLEIRAADFGVRIEVTDQGETVYQFSVGGL